MRLSGWHRLFVVVTVLWTISLAALAWQEWERLHQPDPFAQWRPAPSAPTPPQKFFDRAVLALLVVWVLPPIVLYGLGWSAGWVYRGFTAAESPRLPARDDLAALPSSVKCPRCGLLNPGTAQRCDCGYDFETRTVKSAYYKQELPREFRTYLILAVALNVLVGTIAAASGDLTRILLAGAWSVAIWWLYSRLIAKQNWARLALAVLTFPAGLLLGLSREARLYCLQK